MTTQTPAESAGTVNRAQAFWANLGGKLGVGLSLLGFVVLFLGWNGAASFDRVPSQFPYLISGGLVGLSLVVLGAAMIVVDNQRADRAAMQATLLELRSVLETMGAAGGVRSSGTTMLSPAPGQVVAGSASFHRPSCHLVDGRDTAAVLEVDAARERGLSPCRVCNPLDPGADRGAEAETAGLEPYAAPARDRTGGRRRQLKAR
jgi:hypothetical protein